MSIDGPGILASDLAHDVYNQILDLCDAGTDVEEIRHRISEIEAALLDDIDLEIYLAACAKAFWEIGHLAPALHHKLTALIERGTSQELWSQAGDESLAKARKLAVQRLLRQIALPRKSARPRKKYAQVRSRLRSRRLPGAARGRSDLSRRCLQDPRIPRELRLRDPGDARRHPPGP
jgi:hypothetical protein